MTDVTEIASQISDDEPSGNDGGTNGSQPAASDPPKPPPKRRTQRQAGGGNKQQPTAAGIPKNSPLSKLVPGAERVRIEHREDDGHLAHCGDYGERDIASVGDVKSFIQRYHAQRYGAGDYYLTYINAKGDEIDAGVVHIPQARDSGERRTSDEIKELLAQQEQARREAKQEAKEMAQQMMQQNPFTSIKDAAEAMSMLQGYKSEGGGMDPMVLMMMNQQQQQAQQQMMQMLKRDDDSGTTKVVEKILERIERLENESNSPPPPPPPPPAPQTDPMESFANALANVAEIMRPQQKEQNPLDDVLKLKQLLGDNDKERMTTRDMMEMFKDWRREIQPEDGSDTFKSRMNELMMLMQFTQQMGGNQGGTFWDFAKDFLDRFPDNAEAFAQAADQVRHKQAQQSRARRQPPQRQTQRMTQGEQPQAQRQAQPAQQPADGSDRLPDSFKEYAQAIEEAEDDASLIEAGLHALNHLREHERWQSIPNTILLHLHDGNMEDAFDVLDAFFEAIQTIGVISEETVYRAQKAFREHIEQVLAAFGFEMPEGAEVPDLKTEAPEGEQDDGQEPEGEQEPEGGQQATG